MKIQLRLKGEDLYAFQEHLARRCWAVLSASLPDGGRLGHYRSLYRRLKAVLTRRIEARQYCGGAFHCDSFLHPVEPGQAYRKVVPAAEAEHTHHYLLTSAATPGQLMGELSKESLLVLADARRGAKMKGVGRRIHRMIREVFKDHLYRNEACGETPLCSVNEPVSPWIRHPQTRSVGQYAGEQ